MNFSELQLRCRSCGHDFEFHYKLFVANMEACGLLVTYPKCCLDCFNTNNPGTAVGGVTYPSPHEQRIPQEFSAAWEPAHYACGEYFVYILELTGDEKSEYYIGHTSNIFQRVRQHQWDLVNHTKGRNPRLVWFSESATRDEATKLEAELKSVYLQNVDIIEKVVRAFKHIIKCLYHNDFRLSQ